MKIFQHENLSYDCFLTRKFPDLRYHVNAKTLSNRKFLKKLLCFQILCHAQCTDLQLEKERCDLLEELQSVKAKLSSTEKELEEKNSQLKQLKTNYDRQTKSLNQEIIEVASINKLNSSTKQELSKRDAIVYMYLCFGS